MPLYEYKCSKCGDVTEHIHKYSDPPLTDCQKCGTRDTLVKQIGRGTSFRLIGDGWFRQTAHVD